MKTLLFLSLAFTLIDIFLIVYAWTLQFFPKTWREKVNSQPRSLNPQVNNDSLTGILIIFITAIACALWATFFYVLLLVPKIGI